MIEINGMEFEPVDGIVYRHDYVAISEAIAAGKIDELGSYRSLVETDLFFIVYFILKIPTANHPFVVQACKEVETGPKSHTLDLWAREHFKSTIVTIAETIQKIIVNPEERIALFSYAERPAMKFFRQIMQVMESSELLKACTPDVLFQNPSAEAYRWSENAGLYVKRKGLAKEPTLTAYGLIEGMPTGSHFTHRVYDDVVTEDLVNTPEIMQKVKDMFDLSQNLGTMDGTVRVLGTPYHHEDALMYIEGKKDPVTEEKTYHCRKKPATLDGTHSGEPVLVSPERLSELRSNDRRIFAAQQLVDPTPVSDQRLNPSFIKLVTKGDLPQRLYKFMTIDQAGERQDARRADSWAMHVIGVEPFRDDLGASRIFILDSLVEPLSQAEAMEESVAMYLRNGRILKLGVEKVALSTTEIHLAAALRARGKSLTIKNGSLVILRPGGRSKKQRIEANLAWPLNNGKIHMCASVPTAYRERLAREMEKFPFYHDDALDALSYVYDIIGGYRFPKYEEEEKPRRSIWDIIDDQGPKKTKDGWLLV